MENKLSQIMNLEFKGVNGSLSRSIIFFKKSVALFPFSMCPLTIFQSSLYYVEAVCVHCFKGFNKLTLQHYKQTVVISLV